MLRWEKEKMEKIGRFKPPIFRLSAAYAYDYATYSPTYPLAD